MNALKWMTGLLLWSVCCNAATGEKPGSRGPGFPRWSPQIQGGALYQPDTSLDDGGSVAVSRFFVEGGVARMWRFDRFAAFSVGGGRDEYDFTDRTAPWGHVENMRVSLFSRWRLNERWVLFGGPSLRAYAEEGAALSDAWTASFFAGSSYAFSDRLKLGPGFGVIGRLEENPLVIPIIVVNWEIIDRLSLTTGGGVASTVGPGLSLVYEQSDKWVYSLSGRYDSRRFRLNRKNTVPEGLGEDSSSGMYGSIIYKIYPRGQVSFIIGYIFDGKIELEDRSGRKVGSDGYKNAITAGILFGFDF